MAVDGTLSVIGYLGEIPVNVIDLLMGRKKLTSSGVGGRPSTRAMLSFCAEHGITADIELLPSAQVEEAPHPPEARRRPLPIRLGHVRPSVSGP